MLRCGVKMMRPGLGQLLLFVVVALAGRQAEAVQETGNISQQTCGLASCHELKSGMLNVHLVPHSHDDLGWLKTVDQYYYGLNNSIDNANVSEILDSVLEELNKDSDRRFIQVETAYLWMWWQQQSEAVQEQYRQLVQSGRVQITGGGWSMPDEATTSYQALIDNFSWGFKFLYDTFGECGVPTVGWQIDSFGHSRETASIMAAMGLQGTFLGRLDYQDLAQRKKKSSLEFTWHASDNLGSRADIFASALYDGYAPPSGCCWDVRCGDAAIGKNAATVVKSFVTHVTSQAKRFRTKNVLLTMGNDFTYMDANKYYTNIDKLIELVNDEQKNGSTLNLFYSTPACYVKAVKDAKPRLLAKSDDFLPYAEDGNNMWTGYYTSRPTLKYFERVGNNFLQVCKQLSALAGVDSSSLEPLDALRRAVATLQHHDAVTGTHRSHVGKDYAKTLSAAMQGCGDLVQTAINALIGPATRGKEVAMKSCPLLNTSQCEESEQSENFIVTVYNPLSRTVSHYVRLPVKDGSYSVTALDGTAQTVQMMPVTSPVLDLKNRQSLATQEVIFQAVDVPPMGLRSYKVSRTSSSTHGPYRSRQVEDTFIGNSNITVKIDSETGLLKYVVNNGKPMAVQQNFYFYESRYDDGAYTFKPQTTTPIQVEEKATFTVYKGELVEEIHQLFNDWVSQVIRVYKEDYHAEFEWLVGPIPETLRGRQIISKFSTNLNSNGTFYTDSNGREVLQRKLDYRPTYELEVDEPVSANYFPVPSRILIKDEVQGLEFAVLTDRSQGGSSLAEGQVELMIHRRMQTDDFKGLNEVLNDTEPARGKHFVFSGESNGDGSPSIAARQRLLAEKNLLQPWVFLSPSDDWPTSYKDQFSGVRNPLPDNVHVLTLEPWGNATVLLRLEHIMEKSDDAQLSRQADVYLEDIFAAFSVVSFREAKLDGSQWLSEEASNEGSGRNTLISLSPMQIRTFVVTIEHGK